MIISAMAKAKDAMTQPIGNHSHPRLNSNRKGCRMRVLIACEYSGVVREQFRRLGHDAVSCDIEHDTDLPSRHIKDDVLALLNDGWDLMIGHPPCTYLANSGNKHLYIEADREKKAQAGAALDLATGTIGVLPLNKKGRRLYLKMERTYLKFQSVFKDI